MVPPFDHEWIIEGQGTCGLEILEQVPDVGRRRRADGRRRTGVGRRRGGQAVGIARDGRRCRTGRRREDDRVACGRPSRHARERRRRIADGLMPVRPGDHDVRARPGVRRRGRDGHRRRRSPRPRCGCFSRRSRSSSRAAPRPSPRCMAGAGRILADRIDESRRDFERRQRRAGHAREINGTPGGGRDARLTLGDSAAQLLRYPLLGVHEPSVHRCRYCLPAGVTPEVTRGEISCDRLVHA